MLACEGSASRSAAARSACNLKLFGLERISAVERARSFCQSVLRAQVRMAKPAMSRLTATGAKTRALPRGSIWQAQTTRQARNPASGRYKKRSAITVPIGNSKFDVGRKAIAAKPAKKKAARFQR